MKRLAVLALALALVGAGIAWRVRADASARVSADTPPPPPPPPTGFDGHRAWADLEALVALGPRPAGSPQIAQARAYITRELAGAGLIVQEQPFTASTPYGPVAMENLIVRLPGRRADRIVLSGHYDTKLLRNQVFVGADDGGSSAAVLLELARVL